MRFCPVIDDPAYMMIIPIQNNNIHSHLSQLLFSHIMFKRLDYILHTKELFLLYQLLL